MTLLAAVVMAHTDPTHLRRLVLALDDVPIFLHCDARTPEATYQRMTSRLPLRVTLCARQPTTLSSWSLVDAELRALRVALARTSARHIAVLSGADYPLLAMPELERELSRWDGFSWLWNVPLPYRPWSTPRHPDGGLWRLRRRFLTWRNQVMFVKDVPLRLPVSRSIPADLEPRAGSQWKIYARHHAEALVRLMDGRPDLVRYWRGTLVPDETFAASMLGSRSLLGSDALPACYSHPWHMAWPAGGATHPGWLTMAHFDDLARAQKEPPADPVTSFAAVAGEPREHRRLFARKFGTAVDTDVLDRIDAELRA
ncbi:MULTISPECIES: beta-1,6-N-acetylglucosaminyltransferase [Pseudofrankia]|uniref:beta-1,6-N-acetylglucosaminyltransferase n=1 Tax=Pseudofrankia TaxID=2994363 RepID=UPI000234BF17|nr:MULTISPECIES: beta-1,6-N-acetylglucosaminyltransferase [Pseudofrankia]OHV37866.1 glycosyl transferase family 14 [Pseudofrankia sp. EUN1h]